jgi:hypothetical protein
MTDHEVSSQSESTVIVVEEYNYTVHQKNKRDLYTLKFTMPAPTVI